MARSFYRIDQTTKFILLTSKLNIMSSAKTLLGVLAVGAAGVAVGMLLAPEKGEKTRNSLKDALCDLGDKISSFVGEGKERAEDTINEIKQQARGLKDDAKSRIDNAKDAAKEALS